MFVIYMHCKESHEGDPAGYVVAVDDVRELNELDYELGANESLWIVPGTIEE